MREILFRGKRCDNGEWVNGSLLNPYRKKPLIAHYENEQEILGYTVEVISDTVGQYTGLTDKNGKRIFEGDIVDVDNALVSGRFWVEYGVSGAFIVKEKDDRRYFLGGCNCTVIGNIHDNPELLEGED